MTNLKTIDDKLTFKLDIKTTELNDARCFTYTYNILSNDIIVGDYIVTTVNSSTSSVASLCAGAGNNSAIGDTAINNILLTHEITLFDHDKNDKYSFYGTNSYNNENNTDPTSRFFIIPLAIKSNVYDAVSLLWNLSVPVSCTFGNADFLELSYRN